jgi:chromosome segregation protein
MMRDQHENAAVQADAKMREIMDEQEQTLLAHTQEMQAAHKESSCTLDAVKSQVTELHQEIEQHKSQHEAELDMMREQHENALAQHNETDAAETTTNDELQQTNLELQMEIEHQQSVLSNLNEEKKSLTHRTEELSEQVAGLQEEVQQEQHVSQERHGELQHKLEQIRASAVTEATRSTEKLQKLEKLLEEATSGENRALELEQELAVVTAKLSEREQEVEARTASVEKAQRQLNKVKNEAQKHFTRLQSQAAAKEENVQLLTSELAQAHAAVGKICYD